MSRPAESMRTPATPRSNQKRRMSSCSARTSGWFQLRSGCSGVKRCRYHSPGVPSGLTVRVHVSPWKFEIQLVGISSPFGPLPGWNQKRSRSGLPGPAARACWNQRVLARDVVRDDVDDRADAELEGLADEQLGVLEGAEGGVDVAVVRDVVAAVGERRRVPGVEPERVDAELLEVPESTAHAAQVAGAVAVRVREAADVDLVDHRAAPPQRILHEGRGHRAGFREWHGHAVVLLRGRAARRVLRRRRRRYPET